MVMSDSIIRQSIANSIGLDSFNENNPADCLAAITFFKIDILWLPNGWAAANFGCEQAETRTTIEAAVFEACKQLVEE